LFLMFCWPPRRFPGPPYPGPPPETRKKMKCPGGPRRLFGISPTAEKKIEDFALRKKKITVNGGKNEGPEPTPKFTPPPGAAPWGPPSRAIRPFFQPPPPPPPAEKKFLMFAERPKFGPRRGMNLPISCPPVDTRNAPRPRRGSRALAVSGFFFPPSPLGRPPPTSFLKNDPPG